MGTKTTLPCCHALPPSDVVIRVGGSSTLPAYAAQLDLKRIHLPIANTLSDGRTRQIMRRKNRERGGSPASMERHRTQ